MIGVSTGTAAVLGLKKAALDAPPTTAYLLAGNKCLHSCAFCSRSRQSAAPDGLLSRVLWPQFPAGIVTERLTKAAAEQRLARVCLQVVRNKQAELTAKSLLQSISSSGKLPVSVSCHLSSVQQGAEMIELGAQRLSLALDGACESIYRIYKGPAWQRQLDLLEALAAAFPGRISTHLIVGLGETEQELVEIMAYLNRLGITIGLFAFTPVPGTTLANAAPPPLSVYRRIQAARYLLQQGLVEISDFSFRNSVLIDLGLDAKELRTVLGSGQAFRTSGCLGCNRPYYNERPGAIPYNYPYPPGPAEVRTLLAELGIMEAETYALAHD